MLAAVKSDVFLVRSKDITILSSGSETNRIFQVRS
jgi:hypothetical protein